MSSLSTLWDLTGQVAVVTGGSRGIGRAIVEGLSAAGARVVVSSRSLSSCEEVANRLRGDGREATAIACDVGDETAIEALFAASMKAQGPADIFVHAAGLPSVAMSADVPRQELERMMRVHFSAGVLGAQQAAAQMRREDRVQKGGAIVMVSSVWGLGAQPASIAYGSAKAALSHAVKVMAVEWARYGIRVNALAPGLVETDMTSSMKDDVRDKLIGRIPMRRAASPDEMVGPALFLSSDASSYMTGQTLVVDGGERAR